MNDNRKEYIRLCSIPAVQEKIGEAMGNRVLGDKVIDSIFGEGMITSYLNEQCFGVTFKTDAHCGYSATLPELAGPDLIRLPQAIDLQNPERGLWGMVDWKKNNFGFCDDGTVMRYLVGIGCESTTPELALLKACMHQWGIEL
jgi:hypothetical protein